MPKILQTGTSATREKTMYAQKSRTAEVTICIIPEGVLDRSGQIPYAWKPRLSKTTSTVSLSRVSNVLLMIIHYDIHTELSQEINTISHCAVITVPSPRTLANWILMKFGQPGQPSRLPWVLRSRSARFLQTLQAGPSSDGNRSSLPQHNEKGLSIVTAKKLRQTSRTQLHDAHNSKPYNQVAVLSNTTTIPATSVPMVLQNTRSQTPTRA